MNENPGYARPPGAQESAGLATGDEYRFADGHKVGEVVYRFGARATVTRDMPGWYIADGTQPDLIVAGVNYGKPDLRARTIFGANDDSGGAGTFPLGATGGVTAVGAHTHSFTQPDAHVITQPVFAGPVGHLVTDAVINDHGGHTHDNNHSGAAAAAHATHGFNATEVAGLGGSGIWAATQTSAANVAAAAGHSNNHSVTQPTAHSDHGVHGHGYASGVSLTNSNPHAAPARTTDVALTNNHSGGAVGAVTGAASGNYPPYIAVWPLLKVR